MIRPPWIAVIPAALLSCVLLMGGDEPKQPAAPPIPFPPHYRKLGLNDKQVKNVRKTRAKYRGKVEELRNQIQALQKEEAAELEKFLTDTQKARLKELQAQGTGTFKVSGPLRAFSLRQGRDTTFAVELRTSDAFEGEVRLTYPDLPRGLKIEPNPFVFKEGGNPLAELKITADKDAPVGEHRFIIKATPDDGEPIELTVKVLVKS
jgi:hypothetical protein